MSHYVCTGGTGCLVNVRALHTRIDKAGQQTQEKVMIIISSAERHSLKAWWNTTIITLVKFFFNGQYPVLARMWSNWGLSYIAGGNVKQPSDSGSQLDSVFEVERAFPYDAAVTVRYIYKWNKNACPHKDVVAKVHGNVHNHWNLGTIQCPSADGWINKLLLSKFIQGKCYSAIKRDYLCTQQIEWTSEAWY